MYMYNVLCTTFTQMTTLAHLCSCIRTLRKISKRDGRSEYVIESIRVVCCVVKFPLGALRACLYVQLPKIADEACFSTIVTV